MDGAREGGGGVVEILKIDRVRKEELKGDLHILFWNVTSLILRGENSVGGLGVRAVPAAGVCAGVKYGMSGAPLLIAAMFAMPID